MRPDGKPIKSFREGWEAAGRRAGLEGRRFHDLRRTAVRNMELSGKISRKVAMLISGHLTEEVYKRYHIGNESDLSAATTSMVGYYQEMAGKIDDYSKTVTNAVTMEAELRKKGNG